MSEAPTLADRDATAEAPVPARESPGRHPATVTFTLRDLMVVTYAVPVDRVRPQVPESLALDMLPSPEGDRLAFVQTLCAFHENAHWSVLPLRTRGQSFHQITYRVLTRRAGRRGAFALRTYVSTDEGRAAQRALSRDAGFARFALYIAGDPARGAYSRYTLRAQGDQGQTQVEARAIDPVVPSPFTTAEALTTFLIDRPDNYFRASAPKSGIGLLPQQYGAPAAATFAELVAPPRLSLWSTLGLGSPEELQTPYVTLLIPSVTVTSLPPRFARLGNPASSA
jgi:hypothetical protein